MEGLFARPLRLSKRATQNALHLGPKWSKNGGKDRIHDMSDTHSNLFAGKGQILALNSRVPYLKALFQIHVPLSIAII